MRASTEALAFLLSRNYRRILRLLVMTLDIQGCQSVVQKIENDIRFNNYFLPRNNFTIAKALKPGFFVLKSSKLPLSFIVESISLSDLR